jgi:hypothetical protein
MNTEEMNSKEFNAKFWEWFDETSIDTRKKFWYYPSDMAKLHFYNKIWKFLKNEKE